jgi:hypothetical protein
LGAGIVQGIIRSRSSRAGVSKVKWHIGHASPDSVASLPHVVLPGGEATTAWNPFHRGAPIERGSRCSQFLRQPFVGSIVGFIVRTIVLIPWLL